MKVDFETLAAILSLTMNAAGVATLARLLTDKSLTELYEELNGAIKTKLSNRGFVSLTNQTFARRLFSFLIIFMHLVNILIFVALYLVLIIGPENIHPALFSGTVAEPLTLLEQIIYATAISLFFLAYLIQCFIPTVKYCIVYRKAKDWLRQNEPHRSVVS